MVDQQDRFYHEVLELSRNNTSKHNVLYTKEKVDELIDKVLHAKTVLKKKDPRNVLGVIEEVSEYGYRVGTSVGTLSGYLCRNQIEAVNNTSLSISMILFLQISWQFAKFQKSGGQGYLSWKCKGGCKTSKCKCKKKLSCVIHVVMVLWHVQTSKCENWKLIELKVLLTWFCKILLMCFLLY